MHRSFMSLLSLACGVFVVGTPAHAGTQLDPTGVWLVEDGQARIRVEPCGQAAGRMCGYIVWTKDGGDAASSVDSKNPDLRKRTRPVLGMQLMLGLTAEDADYAGRLYNAENGKTYDVKIWRDDERTLTLKGCVMTYLCRSQKWAQVEDLAVGQLSGPTDGRNGPRADAEWAKPAPAKTTKLKH